MTSNRRSEPKNAYRAKSKVIHVNTPGIFHFAASGCNETRCGRDMSDARMTDHSLLDQQPCVVCFENWDRSVPGSYRNLIDTHG